MEITEDLIKHIADLANLNLTIEELKKFTPELKEILNFFSELDKVDVKNTKIRLHPVEIKPTLREDKPDLKKCLTQEQALSLIKNKKDGYFKGPKSV